ncbi:AMP phosphorylase [Candidatus Gugararchaeum adminiculabundum]|nr:AMP phosphorylase [Candidatus Gugararchaeum adminiculabundum]
MFTDVILMAKKIIKNEKKAEGVVGGSLRDGGIITCKAKVIDIEAGARAVVLNEDQAKAEGIYLGNRVRLKSEGKESIAIVDVSDHMVKPGEILMFADSAKQMNVKNGDNVNIWFAHRPSSIDYIKKKMDGKPLNESEIKTIISELMDNKLSEVELACFITSVYVRGLSPEETVSLTNAICNSGETLDLGKKPVVDKHCSGGVAGNRTTMLLVPIIAAAGLYIPKTSSRAITSAAGTADTMEVLAPVNFDIDEMRETVLKTHGCMVWGGGVSLAPADDKLIRIRYPLSLDPREALIASILAKKKSVGAEYVVIDIPTGRGSKHEDTVAAQGLAQEFLEIGAKLGMKIEVLITDGSDPIGNGIGPGLECRDVLWALSGDPRGPADLIDKSCQLAGVLLELCGKVDKGKGYSAAKLLLENGKAYKKMLEIIDAQGGNPKVKIDDLPIGQYKYEVKADKDGRISHADNKILSKIARAAGAPKSPGAGVYLHAEKGDKVKKGDVLFEIISDTEGKLDFAIKSLESLEPIELQKVIIGKIGGNNQV